MSPFLFSYWYSLRWKLCFPKQVVAQDPNEQRCPEGLGGGNKECAGRERKAERRERKGWEAGLDMEK